MKHPSYVTSASVFILSGRCLPIFALQGPDRILKYRATYNLNRNISLQGSTPTAISQDCRYLFHIAFPVVACGFAIKVIAFVMC